jgi:uncharacterized paraquat-inducible protein A
VPWCEECDQLVEEEELTEEGACPDCGTVIEEQPRRIPWYWILAVVATVIYLIWRAYQGISWLAHHA